MPLSWNEIRARAGRFAELWQGRGYEKGDTGQYYHQFFEVFGQKPRDVNIYFEKRVKLTSQSQGFIDLFWPGTLLVEQKSQGRNLAKARAQATDYYLALKDLTDEPAETLAVRIRNARAAARRKTELEVSGHRIIGNVLSGILPVYDQLANKGWNTDGLDDHATQVRRALLLDLRGISSAEQALHGMADFISGMTDRYALRISRMLSGT